MHVVGSRGVAGRLVDGQHGDEREEHGITQQLDKLTASNLDA